MHDQENVNAVWLNIGQLGIVIKWEKVKEHLCIERKRGKVILKQDNVADDVQRSCMQIFIRLYIFNCKKLYMLCILPKLSLKCIRP